MIDCLDLGPRKENLTIDEAERRAKEQAVIENLKPACLCNKIRKGTVLKAIQAGASTFEQISKRTGVGTGPCGGRRCGSMVRGLLGEAVVSCNECGWPVLAASSPQSCPRCDYARQES
ncbi:MAG: (2Fe-2S)-binding protein [Candidatus Binatia bacterium]